MNEDTLISIRNILINQGGMEIIHYLSDLATDLSLTAIDEKELKGFMRAIAELKRVPERVESIKNRK